MAGRARGRRLADDVAGSVTRPLRRRARFAGQPFPHWTRRPPPSYLFRMRTFPWRARRAIRLGLVAMACPLSLATGACAFLFDADKLASGGDASADVVVEAPGAAAPSRSAPRPAVASRRSRVRRSSTESETSSAACRPSYSTSARGPIPCPQTPRAASPSRRSSASRGRRTRSTSTCMSTKRTWFPLRRRLSSIRGTRSKHSSRLRGILTGPFGSGADPAAQVLVAPSTGPQSAWAVWSTESLGTGTQPAFDSAGLVVPGGYELERQLPWSSIAGGAITPPQAGDSIGFDVACDVHGMDPKVRGFQSSLSYLAVDASPACVAAVGSMPPILSCDDRLWCL